jgi:antitoxin (DNA-binding transcriptional repressor) of toxin-antitoxin stability system
VQQGQRTDNLASIHHTKDFLLMCAQVVLAKSGQAHNHTPQPSPRQSPPTLGEPPDHLTMRSIGLAQAKAQLSALLDAVEIGDEVVITRRGQPVARLVRENAAAPQAGGLSWPERLRLFHTNQPPFAGDAVALVRELREERE